MTEFFKGTLDTMINRLCKTIASFDAEWENRCVPATKNQIQQLENIIEKHNYTLPIAYLEYLKKMGQDDGGLLEREWDGFAEPNIDRILELFNNEDFYAIQDLEKGLFLFSYHWTETHSYLKLSDYNDNPVVLEMNGEYFSGSFEKYLFWKAFKMYDEKFTYHPYIGTSVNDMDTVLKKYGFPCSVNGGTREERMNFAKYLVEPYNIKKTWFSDELRYFSYDERYALTIDIRGSLLIEFSCNDPILKKQAMLQLNKIFHICK